MVRIPEQDLNLVQILLSRVNLYGKRRVMLFKRDGAVRAWTWRQWADRFRNVALGLHARGFKKGDRAGILSENRPEWTLADVGVMSLGGVVVPIYATSAAQDVAYVIRHAGMRVLFVSSEDQFQKVLAVWKDCPDLKLVVMMDALETYPEKVVSLDALAAIGRLEKFNNENLYTQRVRSVQPGDLATILYTSGTTGPPKGVMLTHQNLVANYLGAKPVIPVTDQDISISFLPLSHIFERLAGYYFMLAQGASIGYAQSMQTVVEDMAWIRPTVAAAVPRFYEKLHTGILEAVEQAPPLRRKIFYWAERVGTEAGKRRAAGQDLGPFLSVQFAIAKQLVFNKIQRKLGGRMRFFISGGAPLSKELAEFFYAADVLILEGYGLTETSPVIAVNSPRQFKFGTVGKPLQNAQVKISEDGEILTKGPCVMKGYYQNPEATQEAIRDGWFFTGDIGKLDDEGYLIITDRKKDLIVTSGGKNIAPQNIENLIMGDTLFQQVVIVGDRRPYLVALIYPSKHEVERFAEEAGIAEKDWPRLLKHEQVKQWAEKRLRERMKDLASYEQIKYFDFLENEMTQAAGELTPTLKVKRKVVFEKYRGQIDALYQAGNQRKTNPAECAPSRPAGPSKIPRA